MTQPNPYQLRILAALNILGKHVYAGKETPQERAARRRDELVKRAIRIRPANRAARRLVARHNRSLARAERRAARKEPTA